MASVNRATLLGNLGADPETRYLAGGDAVCNIRLATTEQWKDRETGEKQQRTEWHRVVFYRKQAEVIARFCKKGSPLYVEGVIRTRKWTDKEGVDRYTTEIEGRDFQLLGDGSGHGAGSHGSDRGAKGDSRASGGGHDRAAGRGGGSGGKSAPSGDFDNFEDDIPF